MLAPREAALLSFRRAHLAVVPMTSDELLSLLPALPGARRLPADLPLIGAVMVAGMEVAATTPAPERALRSVWRQRRGSGATPLLLLCDEPVRPGSVLALGLLDAGGPLRSIETGALHEVLQRVATRPRLEAVRELTAELDRLDQAGIPGLELRDLLTLHTLDHRLRGDPARWQQASDATKAIRRGANWRTVLTALGYELERRQRRGWLARHAGRPVAVVHPKANPGEFARLDEDGRPPEGVLLNDCATDGAPFGLLVHETRLRLFQANPTLGAAATRYLDLDAASLQDDDRPFLALLGPEYLADGQFTTIQQEARDFGVGLRQRLDETIRQTMLPVLGRAFGRWARARGLDPTDDQVREELEQAALTMVFRALFMLYAESSGYLPMANQAYRRASLTSLVDEAAEARDRLGARSTMLWDQLKLLVKAMRNGNPAWGVPAYNGALFAADGFEGASTLEQVELTDPDVAAVLIGLGRDLEGPDQGVDYSTLEIGHLGHIYEGLLSLRLSVADAPLRYDPSKDRYISPGDGERADVEAGDLLWQTNEGGRKGGGVYYTRAELVRHLVQQAVAPAFGRHLDRIRELAATDPEAAAAELLDFAVLDPACGSAHFLVVVVNELADHVVRFLGETPLPEVSAALDRLRAGAGPGVGVDDVALLRRLVLKHCVFGVDVSPMGAEVATVSLWLASFVPGLSLAYLGRNVVVGNSLVGVLRPEALRPPGHANQAWFLEDELEEALGRAAQAAQRVAEGDDRTPDEYEASQAADAEARAATAALERLFDLWTAEPFGLARARQEVELHGPDVLEGRSNGLIDQATALGRKHRFLHWPLAFPRVFARPRPGFDAVIGNPPWNEVTVEALAFYGLFSPGLRSLTERPRAAAVAELLTRRPDLSEWLAAEQDRAALERRYLAAGEYVPMPGDPDLYKFFCQRYRELLREHGVLGVVLPRSAFLADGSAGFRRWLFEESTARRMDFLLNTGRWAFDSEPRYTVALVAAERARPPEDQTVRVAGTATSLAEWDRQTRSPGLILSREAFGPGWTVPLLRNQAEADLLAKLHRGRHFPYGAAGRWRCFPVAELHETNDRRLWQGATEGWPLWKGESFEQYDPHGAEARICPTSDPVWAKVRKPRPGSGSLLATELAVSARRQAVLGELGRARVAFRDVTRATDSRTVRACLIPPRAFLTNTAPYLAFAAGEDQARVACLGIMNSLPFDWQARRFVEIHLNFFILEGLAVPDLAGDYLAAVAESAARLSCVDERFSEVAEAVGVEVGPRGDDERERLRVEIDARVARAWLLTAEDLEVMLADFTHDAVPPAYRRRLAERLAELS
jgi:hypothetical protein